MKASVESLLGTGRTAVLSSLLSAEGEGPYGLSFREIGRRSGVEGSSLQRELANLENAGLISSQLIGRQRMISLNRESPLYRPVRTLIDETMGIYRELTQVLQEDRLRVTGAFIFGSQAKATDRPDSDLDLFVISPTSSSEFVMALGELSVKYHRHISVMAFDPNDERDFRRLKLPVIRMILSGPKRVLLGPDAIEQLKLDALPQEASPNEEEMGMS